jgi:poly(3-hydroxybutyrate) depolymerase
VIYRVPSNFPGAGRRVYPGFLQHTGFVAMNPDRHMTSHYDYFLDLIRGDDDSAEPHRQFYDEYNAVLDMPAEYYLDTIKTVFQDFALVNGTWNVKGGEAGAPAGHQDQRAADGRRRAGRHLRRRPDQGRARPVHRHPEGRQFHYDVQGAGHYGIFSGRRWREMAYPEVRDFIRRYTR